MQWNGNKMIAVLPSTLWFVNFSPLWYIHQENSIAAFFSKSFSLKSLISGKQTPGVFARFQLSRNVYFNYWKLYHTIAEQNIVYNFQKVKPTRTGNQGVNYIVSVNHNNENLSKVAAAKSNLNYCLILLRSLYFALN